MTQGDEYTHNHSTREVKPQGQCPSCDRYYLKEEAKKAWRNYDCDLVGGNCPKAEDFIPGYIEGVRAERACNSERERALAGLVQRRRDAELGCGCAYMSDGFLCRFCRWFSDLEKLCPKK